jgi:glucose-1-phosphate thymidylyltransferase
MKGVILAGGNGTRLMPLTKVTNKHLLPVGGKPMLLHCVEKMVEADIEDIMIITGGNHLGAIADFFGSGRNYGCELTYRVQDSAGGIAQALGLCRSFVGDDNMCVILGDNIFEDSLKPFAAQFSQSVGAMVILKEVSDPERFGVAEVVNGVVANIEEKPEEPKSNMAVTGVYFYDNDVFDIVEQQDYSDRGELEITDVNNEYAQRGRLSSQIFRGWWTDAGTPDSYKKANELVGW